MILRYDNPAAEAQPRREDRETARASGSRRRGRRSGRASFVRTFALALLALALLRAALPLGLRSYVQSLLERPSSYAGVIDEIDLNLWRGGYEIEGFRISKIEGGTEEPFLSMKKLDLSVRWTALMSGSFVGEAILETPVVRVLTAPAERRSQTGSDVSWTETLDALFPIQLNRLEVHHGRLGFTTRNTTPEIDFYLDEISLTAKNLTNAKDRTRDLVATITAEGRPMGHGRLTANVKLDPFAEQPRFDLNIAVENLDLTKLNDVLIAYGDFDVESGTLHVYAELAAANGRIRGYIKPLFAGLDVVRWGEVTDPAEALHLFWEALVGTTAEVLENQPTGRLATKIPISGRITDPEMDVWTLIGKILQNAFYRTLMPQIDRSIDFEDDRPPAAPRQTATARSAS